MSGAHVSVVHDASSDTLTSFHMYHRRMLTSMHSGQQVCIRLLDDLSRRVEIEEDGEVEEVFDVGYVTFSTFS